MKLVFWLEELSAQVMLENLIPRLFINSRIPEHLTIEYHYFQGKSDLEKNIKRKIEKYFVHADFKVAHLILRDQDSGDCHTIKQNLLDQVSLITNNNLLVRIACRELETFYLGDLSAVEQALKIPNLAKKQEKNIFRDPDSKNSPADLLDKLTKGQYQKVSGSREIGKFISITNSRSVSFNNLVLGIKDLLLKVGVLPTEFIS